MGKEIEKLESLEALVNIAKGLNDKKTNWHWHYFPADCEARAGFILFELSKYEGCSLSEFVNNNNYVIETKRKVRFVNTKEDLVAIKKLNELWYNRC